ncbi:hypothetical protein JCM16303_001379 [Sporobolomyces ruberrimus]
MKRSATTASSSTSASAAKKARGVASGSTAVQPKPAFDLGKLKLVRRVPELDEDEEDDFDEEDPELDYESQWLRRVRYDIVGPKEKVYGKLRFWFIDVETIRTSFYAEMDVPSQECMRFAFTLFDRNGYLKSDFRREGSRAWGTEVKQSSIAYLDEIEIIREERGKGIGTWAMKQIWKTVEHLDVEGLEDIKFLFTLPAPLSADDEDHYRTEKPSKAELAEREAAHVRKRNRIETFFRKTDFRRVGHTHFFCCARDVNHASRKIAAPEDAKLKEPKTEVERARAKKDDHVAFSQMRSQAGW